MHLPPIQISFVLTGVQHYLPVVLGLYSIFDLPFIIAGINEHAIFLNVVVNMAELIHILLVNRFRIDIFKEVRMEEFGQISSAYDVIASSTEYPEAHGINIMVLYSINIC